MTDIKWPGGRRGFTRQIPQIRAATRGGQAILAVDPALGRNESKPAYALMRDGEVVARGIFKVRGGSTQDCLDQLFWAVRDFVEEHLDEPFTLVIEELRGKMVHAHLHWAAGVIVGAANPALLVELPICYWKAHAATDPRYRKGDVADAIQFAKTTQALCDAESVPAVQPRRKRARRHRHKAKRKKGAAPSRRRGR